MMDGWNENDKGEFWAQGQGNKRTLEPGRGIRVVQHLHGINGYRMRDGAGMTSISLLRRLLHNEDYGWIIRDWKDSGIEERYTRIRSGWDQ